MVNYCGTLTLENVRTVDVAVEWFITLAPDPKKHLLKGNLSTVKLQVLTGPFMMVYIKFFLKRKLPVCGGQL